VVKPDDSSLDEAAQRAVELRAQKLLDRANAWKRFPTPVDDIVAAAKLRVAPSSIFDVENILAYAKEKAGGVVQTIKGAISKVFGLYDANDDVIHIDSTVGQSRQNFLKLHETGHHELPAHRKIFRLFQDCEETLSPEIADLFERQANHFARYSLFQGNAYQQHAADHTLSLKVPIKLAKTFGASIYASVREYARTHHMACVVYVLERLVITPGTIPNGQVRRIETSPLYRYQFGIPKDRIIGPTHTLFAVLPLGRRMTRPLTIHICDRNGTPHECIAEAFDTTWNVIILVFPVKELTSTTIFISPAGTQIPPLL
jgi:Zn-dependent peptidase ImmA (M78 family)